MPVPVPRFSEIPPDYLHQGQRYRMDHAYALRDALRRQFIRSMEEGTRFPARAQSLLDTIEELIAAQERTIVLREGFLGAARTLRPEVSK